MHLRSKNMLTTDYDFKNVLADCRAWYPKVKKGGILGGHNYNGSHKRVKQAVKQFCIHKKLSLKVKNNDWWTRV